MVMVQPGVADRVSRAAPWVASQDQVVAVRCLVAINSASAGSFALIVSWRTVNLVMGDGFGSTVHGMRTRLQRCRRISK